MVFKSIDSGSPPDCIDRNYYTFSDPAINGTDDRTLTNTVTFTPGGDTATIDLIPIDDNLYEDGQP